MKCELCETKEILYEDVDVVVAVKDVALTPGHLTVFPKEHFTILEMVPEKILKRCANIATKVSVAVFDGLGSQGTNIMVRNGLGAGQSVPHFAIDVIPRQDGDNLPLEWKPLQLMEDEMELAFTQIQEGLKLVKDTKQEKKSEKPKGPNYLLKSLRRIP